MQIETKEELIGRLSGFRDVLADIQGWIQISRGSLPGLSKKANESIRQASIKLIDTYRQLDDAIYYIGAKEPTPKSEEPPNKNASSLAAEIIDLLTEHS